MSTTGAAGTSFLTGCFWCLGAAGAVAELEHHCLALTCLVFVQWKCPDKERMGAGSLPSPHCKAAEVHHLVPITSDWLCISTGWIPVDAGGKGLRGKRKLGLELGVMLSSLLPASVGTSPRYLKYRHWHRGARQSPALCRARVGQLDLPTLLWPGLFIAADVLTDHSSVQLFESYSFLNKSNLVIRWKDEKPLRLTSGCRLQKVSCICM